jgi:hypothetical protein
MPRKSEGSVAMAMAMTVTIQNTARRLEWWAYRAIVRNRADRVAHTVSHALTMPILTVPLSTK